MSRKILRFILLTYLISWSVALIAYLLHIRHGSLLSLPFLAFGYMPAPAYATIILQKFVYREPLAEYGLTLRTISPRWLLITTVGFSWLIVFGTLLVVAIAGNMLGSVPFGRVDFTEAAFLQQLEVLSQEFFGEVPESLPISPLAILILGTLQSTVTGFTLNFPFTLGEELGWRGLLAEETRQWGFFRSNLFIGVIWGVWHAPIIVQGHNYPGHEIGGIFMMTLLTTAFSFPLAYCRFKSGSIVGPAALHGIFNSLGMLTALFVVGANPLVGFVAGIAGIVVISLLTLAIVLLDRRFVREYRTIGGAPQFGQTKRLSP